VKPVGLAERFDSLERRIDQLTIFCVVALVTQIVFVMAVLLIRYRPAY
jgi:hypothetical protein